ncbi:hypothetical protein CHS0354_012555, partial [Potamilus streckersoni]
NISRKTWYKWLFRIRHNTNQARNDNSKFMKYTDAINAYLEFIRLTPQQQQQVQRMAEEREKGRPRIPSYKLPKSPGHPSLAQQSPPPTPQLLAPAQQQEEEYLPSDASSGS